MCDAKTLSHKGTTMISRCAECQCIFIWNTNIIVSFSTEQFILFKDFINELSFEEHCFPFPDGQDRVMMRTPVDNIQLTFTPDEWEDFHEAVEEAAYMQQVYALIDDN